VLKHFTRAWFACRRQLPESFADAKPDVLPVVRERAYFEWNPKANPSEPQLPHLHLDGHHAAGLVYDFPEVNVSLTEAILNKWGVTFQEAYDVALHNLREISRTAKFRRSPTGFYMGDYRDEYDPARLLLPELFADLDLCGDPVVMLPVKPVLLVTGADQVDGLAAMADYAWELTSLGPFWSGIPMRLVHGNWISYQPEAGHPAMPSLRKLKVCSLARDYRWQKESLEETHRRDGHDVFVATFLALTDPRSNEPLSYCVWTEGSRSLLPRTDLVAFVRPFLNTPSTTKHIMVRWDKAWEVVGHLMVPVDIDPQRYAVELFPNEQELERLRKEHLGGLLEAGKRAARQ
jgi:hypothetical protein